MRRTASTNYHCIEMALNRWRTALDSAFKMSAVHLLEGQIPRYTTLPGPWVQGWKEVHRLTVPCRHPELDGTTSIRDLFSAPCSRTNEAIVPSQCFRRVRIDSDSDWGEQLVIRREKLTRGTETIKKKTDEI